MLNSEAGGDVAGDSETLQDVFAEEVRRCCPPMSVVAQFELRVQFAGEIPRAAGENAALRNDAGADLAFTGAN